MKSCKPAKLNWMETIGALRSTLIPDRAKQKPSANEEKPECIIKICRVTNHQDHS